MDLRQVAHRALGPLRASGRTAEIRRLRVPDHLVVRRRQSLESNALVNHPTRRDVLIIGAGAAASSAIGFRADAQDAERHGISAFGDLKYPADFKNFDYVNVNAPKGGTFSQIGPS